MKAKKKTKSKAKTPAQVEVKVGASAALTRLESEEARLFTLVKNAEASNDPFEAKAARDAWLKVSESLRKFDLLVESAKREVGELVAKKDVEIFLQNIGQLLHWKFCKMMDGAERAWELVDGAFAVSIAHYDPKRSAPVQECPGWMHKALFKHGEWRRGKDLDTTLTAMRIIQEALDHHRDNEHKFFEFLKSHLPAPTPKGSSHEQEENAPA
jgi:hypothetical protein